jgi:Cu+-exporting ATPase
VDRSEKVAFAMSEVASDNLLEFKVSGLHCGGCVATVEKAVGALPGVASVEVSLEEGRARVRLGSPPADPAAIERAVREAGYSARLEGGNVDEVDRVDGVDRVDAVDALKEAPRADVDRPKQKETNRRRFDLRIDGMTCASCVSKVQRALEGVEGVGRADVNFATNRASVEGAASVASGLLIEAVKRAGYDARPIEETEETAPEEAFEAERRRAEADLRGWLVQWLFAGVGSIFIMATMSAAAFAPLHALVATAVQFISGRRFYRGAWRAARARSSNMDTLIILSTTTAWAYGLWLSRAGGPGGAHELMTATMLLTFVGLGKWLEGRGRLSAGRALRALLELAPSRALKIVGDETVEIDARDLRPGDRCRVLQGDRIPADGRLEEGAAEIDESMLTGESASVAKRQGDPLFGGTVNLRAPLTLVVEKVGSATALRQIARRVEEAQSTRPKMQALADAVAAYFVPAVMVVAVLTLGISLALGHGANAAILRAIAVLIVACPCALGLATPLAVMAGVGVAARRGTIVRSAETIETSGRLDMVIFDKTGTLTEGAPHVAAVVPAPGHDRHELLDAAAGLEAESAHPLAEAVREAARVEGILPRSPKGVEHVVGAGVRSAEPPLAMGSEEFLRAEGVQFDSLGEEALRRQTRGETIVGVGVRGGALIGALAIADRIKPSAARAIDELRAMGLKTAILSGDSEATTKAVAGILKIDDYRARVRPEGKADAVAELQRGGRRVAMVGDGINDAPALAQADLGIAVSGGSDIAQEAADIVLMGGDPAKVADAIRLARRIRANMIQNLGWAFVYNLALIPLAAFGILQPIYASAAMAASSVSVVANALRLYGGAKDS